VDREQRAKAVVAAGLFALVVVAVFLFWFVLPAMQGSDLAMAQGGGSAAPGPPGGGPGAAPGGMPSAPGAPGGAPGGGMGAPGGGMGAPGGGGAAAPSSGAAVAGGGSPLEPSRPNPFAAVDVPTPEETFVTSRTKYGHDWKQVPIGYFADLPQPAVPAAPPAAIPPNPTPAADMVRISAIMWPSQDVTAGTPGRAFFTWEGPEGETKVATPGSEVYVTHPVSKETQRWRVTAIERDGVLLRNSSTGESARLRPQARTRAEKRYWGARRLSDDMGGAQERQEVLPGRGFEAPGGAGSAGGAGAMGGGMGMGGAGGMGMGGRGGN